MTLNRKAVLCVLLTCLIAILLSACANETETTTSSSALDAHNNTIYDHSELAWYIQQRYGVDESECRFYDFEAFGQSCLLAKGVDASGGDHYVLRVFGKGVANWYREGSWIIESTSVQDSGQTYNDTSIELVEFVYGNTILHMFVANGKSGKIERMFILAGSDDYFKKEGEILIWEYGRNGRINGLFHSSGLFSEAFYGTNNNGAFVKDYGDYNIYNYDGQGRLERVSFSSAKLKDNVITEIEGSTGVGIGSIVFTYDVNGDRNSVTQDISGMHEVLEYARDVSGKVIQVTISESDLLDSNADSYRASVGVIYHDDGSTEYSDPVFE